MPIKAVGPKENGVVPKQIDHLDRILAGIESTLVMASVFFILALMLLAVWQIGGRVFFDLPLPGYFDYVELMMAVVAFAAIGYAEQARAHIRMDFIPNHLSGRSRNLLELFLDTMALGTIGILVYATWLSFLRAWLLGDSTMDVHLPIWPSKLLLCVALALLWFRLVLSVIGLAWSAVSRNTHHG